jgi:hypothetical protein
LEEETFSELIKNGGPKAKKMLKLIKDSETLSHTLEEAEEVLLRAHSVDRSYLPALEELAHYYDAVKPDPERPPLRLAISRRARRCWTRCTRSSTLRLSSALRPATHSTKR